MKKKKENSPWIGLLLFFLMLVGLIALYGCNPCKFVSKYGKKHGCIVERVEVRDSLVLKDTIIYRDTTIYVELPPDTIHEVETLRVNNQGNIKPIKKRYTSAFMDIVIEIKNNVMTVDAHLNKKQFKVVIRNAVVSVLKRYESYHTKDTTTIVKEPYYPWWLIAPAIIGAITILYIILIVFGKIERG